MTNVLLTDLGLSIPPKFFFENFKNIEIHFNFCKLNYLLTVHFWNVPSSDRIWAAAGIPHFSKWILTLFDMGFFERSVMGGGNHNFVVIAPMIMKFGTAVKFDIFYTMVTKRIVT